MKIIHSMYLVVVVVRDDFGLQKCVQTVLCFNEDKCYYFADMKYISASELCQMFNFQRIFNLELSSLPENLRFFYKNVIFLSFTENKQEKETIKENDNSVITGVFLSQRFYSNIIKV